MKKFLIKLFVMILVSIFSAAIYADTALENQELAKIQLVIRSIYPMLNQADAQQGKNQRIRFRYDWLRRDLASIQQGIGNKLHGILVEPRSFKPIKGDYVEMFN